MGAELPQRILVSHAPPEAFATMTRPILAKLGYAILMPEEFEQVAAGSKDLRPAVRIVDERQLGEVPDDSDSLPIVVLTGRHGVTGADSRIVGAVRRPAGMHELYRLIQQVMEETPRSTPRVPTHLPVSCIRDGHEWRAKVLSLSDNGCLVRSPEPLLLGNRFEMIFVLPREGEMRIEAEAAYQLVPDVGVIFQSLPTSQRNAISRFVIQTLASGPDSSVLENAS
jgi:hypothetical protein